MRTTPDHTLQRTKHGYLAEGVRTVGRDWRLQDFVAHGAEGVQGGGARGFRAR